MAAVIVPSNILVQYPINDWLTWGAFSDPLVFLVSDPSNRALGPQAARRIAWVGFALAVVVSLLLAPNRALLPRLQTWAAPPTPALPSASTAS